MRLQDIRLPIILILLFGFTLTANAFDFLGWLTNAFNNEQKVGGTTCYPYQGCTGIGYSSGIQSGSLLIGNGTGAMATSS